MNRPRKLLRAALLLGIAFTLALALALAAPALGVSASPTPGATPGGGTLPVITDYAPKDGQLYAWTNDVVTLFYTLDKGAPEVDPTKTQLFIAGQPITDIKVRDSHLVNGYQLQINMATPFNPKGTTDFKVVLFNKAGQQVVKEWQFMVVEAKSKSFVDFQLMRSWWWFIAKGAIVTIGLTAISIVFASIFALFGALGRLSRKMSFAEAWEKHGSWRYMVGHTLRMIPYWLATFYTSLFRGTPLLLQIYMIYFALPAAIDYYGLKGSIPYPSAFVSGCAALSLNYGSYLTEVFRAGIQAVPKGQREAAWALGLSSSQMQRRIVLPQAFKIVIPAIGNDFIALIKDTSLVSTIAVGEILQNARLVGGLTYQFISPLLDAALIYWALTIFFSFWQAKLERRMERDRARV
jgi:His/Glu/Gln/Arg/opine family amino acid ABC transporter permease subunit